MAHHPVLIVGGGIAGASTAWWLAQRGAGRDVLWVEREDALGLHSTAKNAAILRTASDAALTRRLARETAEFVRTPPRGFAEHPLLDEVGLVISEGEPGSALPVWASDHLAWGEVERIDDTERERLAPHFTPTGARSWYFPRQGKLDVAALLDAFARGARRGGVELRTRTRVVALLEKGGAVRGARLDSGEELLADRIVLAGGAWVDALARTIGVRAPMRVTRRHLLVSGHDPRVDPRWPVVWDEGEGLYARPESGGMLFSACDLTDVDPDRCLLDPDVMLEVARKTERCLPSFADATAAHFWAGLRTLTVDDAPVVGPDGDVAGLFWVAGLGGHGMSISAGIGRAAADALDPERAPIGG